jgi:hypothetical protein
VQERLVVKRDLTVPQKLLRLDSIERLILDDIRCTRSIAKNISSTTLSKKCRYLPQCDD